MHSFILRPSFFALLILAALFTADSSAALERSQFLAGLRERRLFELAEKYCADQLQRNDLPLSMRADLTVELLQTLAHHAAHEKSADRESVWEHANETARRFLAEHDDPTALFTVRIQDALTRLARGELTRLEAEVDANPDAARASARDGLRQAARKMEEIGKALGELRPGEVEREIIGRMRYQIQFQSARAQQQLALTYPASSRDRVAALTDAVTKLEAPLRELPADDAFTHQVRLTLAACQRSLGQLETARATLHNIAGSQLDPATRLQLAAEQVRLSSAGAQWPRLIELINRGRTIEGRGSTDLDLALLQAYVAIWKHVAEADNDAETDNWRSRAIAAVRFIEQQHGDYWGRRANLELIRAGEGDQSGNVEILSRAADDLYRQSNYDQALATYDKASRAAREAGDIAMAFAMAYKGALIDQQLGRHISASDRFRNAALDSRRDSRAGQSHLMAILEQSRVIRFGEATLDEYLELLAEHIRLWPREPTAATAALWLGNFQRSRQQWPAAADAYWHAVTVSGGDPQTRTAAAEAGDLCWQQWLAAAAPEEASTRAVEIVSQLDDWLMTAIGDPPVADDWTVTSARVALASAKFHVAYLPSSPPRVNHLGSIASSPVQTELLSSEQRTMAELLLAALADVASATQTVTKIDLGSEAKLQTAYELLALLATAPPPPRRPAFQLALADRLIENPGGLSTTAHQNVRLWQAEWLSQTGQWQKAMAASRQLAEHYPDEVKVQIAHAEILTRAPSGDARRQALEQWRSLAGRAQPRTELWFRAKHGVAKTLVMLGQQDEATRLIRYLQVTEDLSKASMAEQFEALLPQMRE
jgi:hypothetical protein